MKEWVYIVKDYIKSVHPLIVFMLLFLIGLFVFWRGFDPERIDLPFSISF